MQTANTMIGQAPNSPEVDYRQATVAEEREFDLMMRRYINHHSDLGQIEEILTDITNRIFGSMPPQDANVQKDAIASGIVEQAYQLHNATSQTTSRIRDLVNKLSQL